MANEINFIKEIEKRECLYNHNLPEYNRRDIAEQAWAEVAKSRNLTVSESKEKWRNIRSSLLRSMKKSEKEKRKKKKKPYYLSPYLQFILPYTKLSQDCTDEQQDDPVSQDSELEIQIGSVKLEPDPDDGQNPFEGVEAFETDILHETAPMRSPSPNDRSSPIYQTRRRVVSRNHENKRISLKRKHSPYAAIQSNKMSRLNYSSMRYFLLSLLPDFESMTEEQIRLFKIKVMMLLDDIKSNFTEMKQNSRSSNDTERLQKRLINLLLRNLKKNS